MCYLRTNPAKYVGSLGYYSDNDSGLQLLGHRYYDPTTGRFITLDPIKDGVNWYAYCGNNPVNGVDPTGHIVMLPFLLCGLVIVGGVYIWLHCAPDHPHKGDPGYIGCGG